MAITDDLRKSVTGNSAVSAALGATERALAGIREVPSRVKSLGSELPSGAKSLQAKVGNASAALKASAGHLSDRASTAAAGVAALAFEAYDDLAGRSQDVVGRLRATSLMPGRTRAKPSPTTVRRTPAARRPAAKSAAKSSARTREPAS